MARKPAKKFRLAPHIPGTQLAWIGIKAVLTLALLFGLVGGLTWLGGRAGQSVSLRGRYTIPFADIRCDAPPGTDRATFLGEVRYLSSLPEAIQSVDPKVPATLTAAFVRHPWVSAVNGVTVSPEGSISVAISFRQPVLAVGVRGSSARLVDATGVLLPPAPPPPGTTTLVGEFAPPSSAAGSPWPDATVKRAAELSATYKPLTIQKVLVGWRLTMPGDKVLNVSW